VILERISREDALSSEGSTLRGIAVHHLKAAMPFIAASHAMPSRCKPRRFRVGQSPRNFSLPEPVPVLFFASGRVASIGGLKR
jgi:hypothetical protein